MLGQARSVEQVEYGVRTFGAAPGGQKMMDNEAEAAHLAMQTGLYVTWRSRKTGEDCCRVGPSHKCFCGHYYRDHSATKRGLPKCMLCTCKCYDYVPSRPEEIGEWWLPRRKGFNVHTWRAKCKCGAPHDAHDPVTRGGPCPRFVSEYLCIVCDTHQEEHETVFESEQERAAAGRPVGAEFVPLAAMPELQKLVLDKGKGKGKGKGKARALEGPPGAAGPSGGGGEEEPEVLLAQGRITTQEYFEMIKQFTPASARGGAAGGGGPAQWRPPNALDTGATPERSVRLMHHTSGGRAQGEAVNKYGLTKDNLLQMGTQRAQNRWLGSDQKHIAGAFPQYEAQRRLETALESAGNPSGSDVDLDEAEAAEARPVSWYRAKLEDIYLVHCPEKTKSVDSLLEKYRGREHELLAKVCLKYKVKH